jgi:hypothetical protein
MYTTMADRPDDALSLLEAECRNRWCSGNDEDSILTVAAAQMLGLANIVHGRDGVVLEYFTNAVQMGQRLGYFGKPEQATKFAQLSPLAARSASFAAWGTFNWTMCVFRYCHIRVLLILASM